MLLLLSFLLSIPFSLTTKTREGGKNRSSIIPAAIFNGDARDSSKVQLQHRTLLYSTLRCVMREMSISFETERTGWQESKKKRRWRPLVSLFFSRSSTVCNRLEETTQTRDHKSLKSRSSLTPSASSINESRRLLAGWPFFFCLKIHSHETYSGRVQKQEDEGKLYVVFVVTFVWGSLFYYSFDHFSLSGTALRLSIQNDTREKEEGVYYGLFL